MVYGRIVICRKFLDLKACDVILGVLFVPPSATSLSFVSSDRSIEGVCEAVDTGSRKAFASYRG